MAKSYGRVYQNKSNVSITPFDIYNLYPVGSIYMSVNSTNPSNYFGGTWEQIKDRFLLACGSTYSNGSTGGEATHTLTVNEIPSHNHEGIYEYYSKKQISNRGDGGGGWNSVNISGITGSQNNTYSYLYTGHTGGSQAHNNMPPYLAVYIWKRVA